MTCPEDQPRVAVVVGHRPSSQGAVSPDGTTEYVYNDELAQMIAERVEGTRVTIVYRDDDDNGYGRLPGQINALEPDAVVSLHFNSFEERPGQPEVSGSEMLHYPSSKGGMRLADLLLREVLDVLELPNRGLKGRGRSGRGGTLLAGTAAPCVLAEPFFGDNPSPDWCRATERKEQLADGYARAISQYARTLTPA